METPLSGPLVGDADASQSRPNRWLHSLGGAERMSAHAKTTSASSSHPSLRRTALRRHPEEDLEFRRGQLLEALTDALVRLLMKQRLAQVAPARQERVDGR